MLRKGRGGFFGFGVDMGGDDLFQPGGGTPVGGAPPPGGGGTPVGGPPPQQPMQPMPPQQPMAPQQPMMPQPPPKQGSSLWKFVAIGCLVLLLIGVVIAGGAAYLVATHAEEFGEGLGAAVTELGGAAVDEGMKFLMEESQDMLTDDVDDEDAERFEELLEAVLFEERERLGLVSWTTTYQEQMEELGEMNEDQEITSKELNRWCNHAEDALDDNGYND